MDQEARKEKLRLAERLLLAGCATLCVLAVILGHFSVGHEQHYVYLAESFLQGKLYFVSMPESWNDTAPFAGKYYWPLGPLPAVLLAPLVPIARTIGIRLYQSYMSLPVILLTSYACYLTARKCDRSPEDSVWLTLAFCAASSYVGVAVIPMSWPFAHVTAVCALFLSIVEWLGRRRWWLIGLSLGLVASARLTAGLNFALFACDALLGDRRQRLKNFAFIATGFALPIATLGAYNFARFGSVIETGYSYQPPTPGDFPGVSLANVLPHLRIFLFGPPIVTGQFPFFSVDSFGMSILILSPWLLYIGTIRMNCFSYLAIINCLVVLITVLAWRSTGHLQLGYRFVLDFLPIVMLLMAREAFGEREVPPGFKVLVCVGIVSSLYFLVSFIEALPKG